MFCYLIKLKKPDCASVLFPTFRTWNGYLIFLSHLCLIHDIHEQTPIILTKRAIPNPCLTLPKIVFQTSLKDPRDAWYSIPSKRRVYSCLVTLLNVSQLKSTFSIHSNIEGTILAPYVSNSNFSGEQLYKDVLPKTFTL